MERTFSTGRKRSVVYIVLILLIAVALSFSQVKAGAFGDAKLYDYIIVGGGTVGCPLARTLAETGKSVLLIERGRSRIDEPQTLDIYGAGVVIANRDVAQPIITTQGVRSHIGTVLGGGSSVNFAIAIQETEEYFDLWEQLSGVTFNRTLLVEASNWARDLIARPMKSTYYGDIWRRGLETLYGQFRGSSPELAMGTSWGGETGFEPSNNWFRRALDVALGTPGVDFPETLEVLVGHTVHRVEFDTSGPLPRATCVTVAATTLADYDTIMPESIPGMADIPSTPLFRVMQRMSTTFNVFRIPMSTNKFCVKRGGDIILSAGAILSPTLLFKSGVGPVEKVRRARAPMLIKDIPELGSNLQDRIFIPIGLFFKDEFTDRGFPARVVQGIAIANVGPNCRDKRIYEKSETCSTVTAEELSGGRLAEGTIYATRYVVPPELRHDPFADFVFNVLEDCAEGRRPLGRLLLQPLCGLVEPIIRCFRRVAANLAFVSETHSTGSLDIGPNGELIVDAGYLKEDADVHNAVRGMSHLIRLVQAHGLYDDLFEPAGVGSCPATVLNGLLGLLDDAAATNYDIAVTPGLGSDANLFGFSAEEVGNSDFRRFIQDELNGLVRSDAAAAEVHAPLRDSSIFESDSDREIEGDENVVKSDTQSADTMSGQGLFPKQKYATYPVILPDPDDPDAVAKFTRSWMTSMWHWTGSAALGKVVDKNFLVFGFENLRIIDASVMNRVTRMNPFITLAALGRYAGKLLAMNLVSNDFFMFVGLQWAPVRGFKEFRLFGEPLSETKLVDAILAVREKTRDSILLRLRTLWELLNAESDQLPQLQANAAEWETYITSGLARFTADAQGAIATAGNAWRNGDPALYDYMEQLNEEQQIAVEDYYYYLEAKAAPVLCEQRYQEHLKEYAILQEITPTLQAEVEIMAEHQYKLRQQQREEKQRIKFQMKQNKLEMTKLLAENRHIHTYHRRANRALATTSATEQKDNLTADLEPDVRNSASRTLQVQEILRSLDKFTEPGPLRGERLQRTGYQTKQKNPFDFFSELPSGRRRTDSA